MKPKKVAENPVYRHARALLQLTDSPRAVVVRPEVVEIVNELLDPAACGDNDPEAAQLAADLIVGFGLTIGK